jgi:hypothetical protein
MHQPPTLPLLWASFVGWALPTFFSFGGRCPPYRKKSMKPKFNTSDLDILGSYLALKRRTKSAPTLHRRRHAILGLEERWSI